MEVNYFQLNRAEYFVPVAVKIPGSELALAQKRGAQRTLLDFIGEVKDEFGITIQNVRDKLDIKLTRRHRGAAGEAARSVRDGLHAAAGQVRASRSSRATPKPGRIGTFQASFVVPEPEPRREADPDQHGRA